MDPMDIILHEENNKDFPEKERIPKFWIILDEMPSKPVLKRVAALADMPVTLLEELAAEGPVPIAGTSTKLGAERKQRWHRRELLYLFLQLSMVLWERVFFSFQVCLRWLGWVLTFKLKKDLGYI